MFNIVMLCLIWDHLYNLKNVKDNHGGALLLVTLQALAQKVYCFHLFAYSSFQICMQIIIRQDKKNRIGKLMKIRLYE